MALTDDNGGNGFYMPVAPAYGGGGNNGGLFGGGDSWLGILFLIALLNGGWGGGFGGFGGGMGAMMMNGGMLGYDFPWLMTGQAGINANTNNGFQNALLNDNVTSIRDGVSNLSTQLCNCCGDMQMSLANGFSGVNMGIANSTAALQNSLCNGFNGVNTAVNGAQNAISTQMYNNELASLNRSFAEQTANAQGFNSLNSQLANCCCEQRAGIADLRYTIATENCADRYEAAQNTRDIIENANRNNQSILDKLCQLELNGKNDRIADLERQLTMANLAASQTAQTARLLDNNNAQTAALLRDNAAQTQALEQYLNPVPIPAYVVQNPNCCPQNNCGCGCGNGF